MSMTHASTQYFDQVAGQWDDLRAGFFRGAVRVAAIRKAYLRPEMVVADVGAGTGFIAMGLAPLVQKVYVVDGSPAMLNEARKNLAAFTNVEYRQADALSLPLGDGSVDVAFANMYLHHCPDPTAAIAEMVRILKPGGRLVITDLDTHAYTWLKEEMADVWMGFEREQIKVWFKDVDLVNVIVDCTGESCCAEASNPDLTDEAGRSAKISIFVATGTRRLAMRTAVQRAYSAAAQGGCGCATPEEKAAASNQEPQASCCSSPAEVLVQGDSFPVYSTAERASVPGEAAEISLGCGNPTAIANLRPGEVVVDIGSGGGMDAFLAANRVGQAGKVIGVDMTPAMLARARRAVKKAGIQNVEFRQGQAEALPVEDGAVDVIISNCVINLCEDKGQVFREAFRVLKPGGRLEVSDIVTSAPLPLEARLNAGEWAACVTGARPETAYLDLVAQAGFEGLHILRSASAGKVADADVYSAIISARKPGGETTVDDKTASSTVKSSSCGCSSARSGCCG